MKQASRFFYAAQCVVLYLVGFSAVAQPEAGVSPWLEIGGQDFPGWTNLKPANGVATWTISEEAIFKYPEGTRGWYRAGFRTENDSSRDWRGYYGLQFEILVPRGRTLELQTTIATPTPAAGSRSDFIVLSKAALTVEGSADWQCVTLSWTIFDFDQNQRAFLKFILELRLNGKFADGKGGEVKLKNIRLIRAPTIALEANVCGKAVSAGETASYDLTLMNCTDTAQEISLNFLKNSWEAMSASVEPSHFQLAPGATAACVVSVRVPENGIPPGGHETQKLLAVRSAGGASLAQIEFITTRDLPHPNILHTTHGWDEVRDKVAKYDWAKTRQLEYVNAAETWQVPQVATPEQRAHGPEQHAYVFLNSDFVQLPKVAIAWQLTRNTNYAQKVALFLRRLADIKTGYPSAFAGTSMGEPQEGENFQSVAIAYDGILDAGVLSESDRRAIEHMFRLYMESVEPVLTVGNIGNWNVAANTAALFCALSMGDLSAANRYLYGAGGFTDYVTKGIMDDGWWWEGSTSYNFWVAAELTQSALACEPWGIDLLHQEFPANFSKSTIVTPWALNPPSGVSFEKWGPSHRNTRSIKQLWDAVPLMTDYRGIAFGMNDGHEEPVGGSRMELAYYAFGDPAYVPLIKASSQRDLIYGVPELPETTAKPYLNSSVAENLGFALLRSQTTNRPPREQIQAVFKIGTQGGFHGHYDRASLDSVMRYGRSFWNPESIWWGYPNFMYKFYVQNSVAHNMVVVDQKQQEAVPSSQLLFFSRKMMQVSAQETDARWSDPPYGGMRYTAADSGGGVASLPELMEKNRQSFPFVTDQQWGELGPFGDRVVQRRLGIVTDDYIVIADYLKGEQPHTFDNLFQMKGFQEIQAADKKLIRHDAQFSADPHSSAQFITDCDWYLASAPAVGKFQIQNGHGEENQHNENGILKMDVHSLWPAPSEIMLAQPPEELGNEQWIKYEVSADGKVLAQGESGVWILGAVNLDVPVVDAKELTIKLITDGGKRKALFLASARFVAADGKELPLDAQTTFENIEAPAKSGEDYYGGPIKIAGVPYAGAIPAQPLDNKNPAVIHIPIAGKNAVRFKATLGGDYPFGDESARRKVFAIRSQGTETHFLTVLEPYEDTPMVKSAVALSADKLRVELADGRVQEITIKNLDGDGKNISAEITENKDGQIVRHESSETAVTISR